MRRLKVRDIMVPLSEYTTLPQDATLQDAVTTLRRVKRRYEEMRDGHRAILIVDEICRKRRNVKVRQIMYAPTEGEYVRANESLDVAIHQLGVGRHQSLLVTEDNRIVGILRLTDIFDVVHDAVEECDMKAAA